MPKAIEWLSHHLKSKPDIAKQYAHILLADLPRRVQFDGDLATVASQLREDCQFIRKHIEPIPEIVRACEAECHLVLAQFDAADKAIELLEGPLATPYAAGETPYYHYVRLALWSERLIPIGRRLLIAFRS